MKESDIIQFRYKGNRLVKGIILRVDPKGLLLNLLSFYKGKNEEWEKGENKYFNKKEMKKITQMSK